MTYLEFVCCQLFGPPYRVRSDGEAYWPCPRCGSGKFHTRAKTKRYPKQRFYCYPPCDWWGDELDLLRELYPTADKAALNQYWVELARAWEAGGWRYPLTADGRRVPKEPVVATTAVPDTVGPFSPGQAGPELGHVPAVSGGYRPEVCSETDPTLSALAAAGLSDAERRAVMEAYVITRKAGVSFGALSTSCFEFDRWLCESDRHHAATCTEPATCDARACRAWRGLPPLTAEEIRTGREEIDRRLAEAARRQQEEYEAESREVADMLARWPAAPVKKAVEK
jgi:hypothetical protein